jgi:hypothetical protein
MANNPANQTVAQAAAAAAAARQSMWNVLKGAGYNVDDVYAHSTDDKGHYERIRVKLSPALEAMMAEIVANDPRYRTPEDFIRDAMVHRAHYHRTTMPALTPVITHEMMTAKLNLDRLTLERWDGVLRTIEATGTAFLEAGALTELGDMLTEYDQDFNTWELPLALQRKAREILEELHDKLKRSRRRDFE